MKHSCQRLQKSFLDLVNVWFWWKVSGRPLHIFGGLETIPIFIGAMGAFFSAWLNLGVGVNLLDTVLPLFAVFVVIIGLQFLISGILADVGIKRYQYAKNEESYRVQEGLQ
jgi:hypothetical protein